MKDHRTCYVVRRFFHFGGLLQSGFYMGYFGVGPFNVAASFQPKRHIYINGVRKFRPRLFVTADFKGQKPLD